MLVPMVMVVTCPWRRVSALLAPARPLLHLLRVAAVRPAALPPAHLGAEAARRAALAELAPAAPGRGRRGGGDLSLGPGQVAAVVLGVVEVSELLAVVGAAHELAPAAGVAVMQPPVCGPVTVTLATLARGLRVAAPPAVVAFTRTPFSDISSPRSAPAARK